MNKKKVTVTMTVIILLLMLLIGTFAWTEYNQHKTNEANGDGIKYDVALIENFKEITSWKVGESYTKEIRVMNTGVDSLSYGDVFVRLQLKEYMEMMDFTYVYTTERLMIDRSGAFVKASSADAVRAMLVTMGYTTAEAASHETAYEQGLEDNQEYYYIKTKAGDDNGQYGKHLLKEIVPGIADSLFGTAERAATSTNATHNAATNGECDYTVHAWTATSTELDNCGLPSHTYIEWELGSNVITYDAWADPLGNNKEPIEAWIFDTRASNTAGWVYWGMPIAPGETTENLLESIQLIRQPDKNFYYAIHTDMQAVSFMELDVKWSDAPTEIIVALKSTLIDSVTISAETTEVAQGGTLRLSAYVSGRNYPSQEVEWSFDASFTPSAGTEINQTTGMLRVGADEVGPIRVIATSQADTTQSSETFTIDVIAYDAPVGGVAAVLMNGVPTGRSIILGVDGLPGTADDNKIVNPVGTVLRSDVEVSFDSGTPYVDLGNGFHLYAGADSILGSGDDIIKEFGNYYQSNDSMPATDAATNDLLKDPIDWRLLDIDDTVSPARAIIVSDQVLDNVLYSTTPGDTTWEDSNLRKWLNSRTGGTANNRTTAEGGEIGFLNDAFAPAEQAKIVDTTVSMASETFKAYVDAAPGAGYTIDPPVFTTDGIYTLTTPAQNDTLNDKVWALSAQEVWDYFGVSTVSNDTNLTNGIAKGNAFSQARGTYQHGTPDEWLDNSVYWVRSSGQDASRASRVNSAGIVEASNVVSTITNTGTRPALTIRLAP